MYRGGQIEEESIKKKKQRKRTATNSRKGEVKKRKRVKKSHLLQELSLSLFIFILVFGTIYFFTVQVVKVEGYSMTPLINDQDRLFVMKSKKIRRFDLVSFKNPQDSENLVQRVIGLPGEELYYKDGNLFVDGKEIPERFLNRKSMIGEEELTEDFSLSILSESGRIPENYYFILGDNRQYASDSRYFGFVKKEEIIGVVKARIFPIHAIQQF